MSAKILRVCEGCGKEFLAHACNVARGAGRLCSRACKKLRAEKPEWVARRFDAMLDKNGPTIRSELGPCWIWTGNRLNTGYGKFNIGGGRIALAHRSAWFIKHGSWPKPWCLHSCDNGSGGCVRIDHLYEGTCAENGRDMAQRGRVSHGEDHTQARLTEADVIRIRELHDSGFSCMTIAKEFGVSEMTVSRAARGLSWVRVG